MTMNLIFNIFRLRRSLASSSLKQIIFSSLVSDNVFPRKTFNESREFNIVLCFKFISSLLRDERMR